MFINNVHLFSFQLYFYQSFGSVALSDFGTESWGIRKITSGFFVIGDGMLIISLLESLLKA